MLTIAVSSLLRVKGTPVEVEPSYWPSATNDAVAVYGPGTCCGVTSHVAVPVASVVPVHVSVPNPSVNVLPASGLDVNESLSVPVSVLRSWYSPTVGPVYVDVVGCARHVTVTEVVS